MEYSLELKVENIDNILGEIEQCYFDIPFGNSQFQIEHFIAAAQGTKERAYKAIGVSMSQKIQTLKQTYFKLKKEDIDMEELSEKINRKDIDKYEKRRLEIDLIQKHEARKYTLKLINDAYVELQIFYNIFKKLPKFTREEFEKGEREYFKLKSQKELKGITGSAATLDSLYSNYNSLPMNTETLLSHASPGKR